jgi:hypothetical protein
MATITTNEHAPVESTRYILPTATFELEGGGSYETDDRTALADAEAHPWLAVSYEKADEGAYTRPDKSVPYEDDVLSAVNSVAFDLDKVRETEEAKAGVVESRLAVESGLDQGEPVEVGNVGLTLASDSTDDDYGQED